MMDDDSGIALTRRRIREVMGRDYAIDLSALSTDSLLELRRLVCDVELMTWQIRRLTKPASSEPSREARKRILGLIGDSLQGG